MSEGDIAKVVQDFLTTVDGELCLKKGDIVQIQSKIDRHWCYGKSNTKTGNVPLNYLIVLDTPALAERDELFAAIADFPGQQPGDLSFAKGELIVGTQQIDENWWHGKIDGVRTGIFPTTYAWKLDPKFLKAKSKPSMTYLKARVKMNMKAQLDEEMDLYEGEEVTITEIIDKDWYRGVCGNQSGIFPSSYVSLIDEARCFQTKDNTVNDFFLELSRKDNNIESPVPTTLSNYTASNTQPSFRASHLSDFKSTDDLSILNDDYFKQNVPTMFSNGGNLCDNYEYGNRDTVPESTPTMELDIVPYGITLYPFYAQFDNELSFHEGEIVTLIRHVSKDWIEGKIDCRKGIFPSSYVRILVDCNTHCTSLDSTTTYYGYDIGIKSEDALAEDSFAIVLYNFDAQMNSDLTVKEGEIVRIVKKVNKDWCEVKNHTGGIGLCPQNYLAPCSMTTETSFDPMYFFVSNNILQDSKDNVMQPTFEFNVNELKKRTYIPDDFQQPNILPQKKQTLDDLILKNLDSLNFSTSWSTAPKRNSTSWPTAPKSNSSSCKSDTGSNDKVEMYLEKEQIEEGISTDKDVLVPVDSCEETSEILQPIEGPSVLNPSRSAPPVPLDLVQSEAVLQTAKEQVPDRVPHRPAPPIPLPGQKPVRRSINLFQKTSVIGQHSKSQNVHQLSSIITAKESQLEYLRHMKEETLAKISSQSSVSMTDEEASEDMEYKVWTLDEKIKFLSADLERLKGTMDKEDNLGTMNKGDNVPVLTKQNMEVQMLPTNPDSSVGGACAGEDERKKNSEQRQNVISELVFTEKEYVRDLKITYETFHLYNPEFLEKRGIDVKTLFGNIDEVMRLAEDFLDKLHISMKGKDEEDQCIGLCFLELVDRMKNVYGDYCMNHDNALGLLEKYESNQDIQKVFSKGLETLRYQITCFDMGSILIKPVQRILKYPLILNELIKCTEDCHKDKPDLLNAVKTVMDVAAYINEYKRRKDIVTKYLEDGNATISSKMSRISLHSVAKKSTRWGLLFTSSLGFGAVTKDPVFHEYETQFVSLEKTVRIFLKNVEIYLQYMHETLQLQCHTAEAITHFYQEKNQTAEEFTKIQKLIDTKFWKQFENTVQRRVVTPLNTLIELFEGPGILVQKRHDKFLDYNASSIKAEKNKDIRLVQENLLIARNNYEALNDQLLEELPILLDLSAELFVECLLAFVTARKLFTGKITKEYLALVEKSTQGEALEVFAVKHFLVLNQLHRLSFLSKSSKYEPSGKKLSKNSPTSKLRASCMENLNKVDGHQPSSQQAYLRSRYSLNALYTVVAPCVQNEPLELNLRSGQLVGVIKRQNPMGNPNIWFVDNGAAQGFVPSANLEPFCSHNSTESTQIVQGPSYQCSSKPSNSAKSLSELSLPLEEPVHHQYEYINDDENDSSEMEKALQEVPCENLLSPIYSEVPHSMERTGEEFYYAKYDFEGDQNQTLTIKTGQVIKVLQQHDLQNNSEWWFVEDRFGARGFVPGNYLCKYTP